MAETIATAQPPLANALSLAIQEAAADAGSLEEALRTALARVCAYTGWKAGRVAFSVQAGELSSRIVWHLGSAEQLQTFRKVAEARRKGGAALAEKVLRDGLPAFELPSERDVQSGRAPPLSTYAFPVQLQDRTLAALEFFTDRAVVPDQALVERVGSAVAQLGPVLERKPAEDALQRARGYRELFESAEVALFVIELGPGPEEGRIIDANQSASALYRVPREALVGAHLESIWKAPGALAARERARFELAQPRPDGTQLLLEITLSEVLYRGKRALLALSREAGHHPARALEQLRASEERYRLLFENNPQPMWVHDVETLRFLAVNAAAMRTYGFTRERFLSMTVDDLRAPSANGTLPELTPIDARRGAVVQRHRGAEGEPRDVELAAHDIEFEGRAARLVAVTDVTLRRKAQARLLHAAFYDPLTGLPNRALFRDRLEVAWSRARGRDASRFAVLFLDVDRFKVVNDGLGHRAGDELLVQIGRRLETCRRAGDTVARLGGDEFTLLVEGVADEAEAVAVAERVHRSMSEPFLVEGHEVFASVSIGIALGGANTEAPEHSLRDADTAMYRAKLRGSRHALFDASMHERVIAALRLENELRRALERDELRVYYQPIVDLLTGRLCGVEALARWQHPERGLISPAEFIPLAEETGLIVELGRAVLERACLDARALPAPLTVSVNLSGRQLLQPDLLEQVQRALARADLSPRRLRLELTESMLIESGAVATDRLEDLRRAGVSLCIDDFGTGYSSLSYLHQLPIEAMKIDASFVKAMVTDERKIKIVQSILLLGKGLAIEVVAEGVETAAQAALLVRLGCERAQGYHFARPLPFVDLLSMLPR